MSKQPPLVTVPLTPEEDAAARLRQLEYDYALIRAAKAGGSRVELSSTSFSTPRFSVSTHPLPMTSIVS
jgi:hypothetical protein